jgi:hypothetical protein
MGMTAGAGAPLFPAGALAGPPDMMRVNSPGCETAGSETVAGNGATADDFRFSSVNLWNNMVMLPGSFAGGAACGLGSPKWLAGGSFSAESARNN